MRNLRFLPFIVAACLPAAAQAPAAQQQSMKAVIQKHLAPVSAEVLHVKMPRPVERKLKNGLRVLVIENHRVPIVTMQLILPATTLKDPEGKPGVAAATAYMISQGTSTRTSRQIAEEVSGLGAGLSVSSPWGSASTRMYASALSENLDPLLAIMADELLHPTFPQDELDNWKKRQLASLQQSRANVNFLGNERLAQVLYSGDARSVISTTAEALAKINRQDLVDFHAAYYVPGSAILGVTGDVTPDAIVAKLDKVLGEWKPGIAAGPNLAAPKPPIPERKIYLIDRPGSVQTLLILANHAITRTSPDYVTAMVANRILGSGPSSRLFLNIREEHGFTYGVGSSFQADKYLDMFMASSSVQTAVTGPALDEFLKEFRRMREEPVPQEELEIAKRAIVAGFALSIENQAGVLRQVLSQYEFGLPADYWDTYPAKVMAVTAKDFQEFSRKYVPFDNVQIVAVGDGAKIKDVLAKYGPVEVYDAEGRKMP
jgi:zinc protease